MWTAPNLKIPRPLRSRPPYCKVFIFNNIRKVISFNKSTSSIVVIICLASTRNLPMKYFPDRSDEYIFLQEGNLRHHCPSAIKPLIDSIWVVRGLWTENYFLEYASFKYCRSLFSGRIRVIQARDRACPVQNICYCEVCWGPRFRKIEESFTTLWTVPHSNFKPADRRGEKENNKVDF